jgi:hypothetical protein
MIATAADWTEGSELRGEKEPWEEVEDDHDTHCHDHPQRATVDLEARQEALIVT